MYPGPVDTEMAAKLPFEKAATADVAEAILDGLAAGTPDIPDKMARHIGETFLRSPKALEEEVSPSAA